MERERSGERAESAAHSPLQSIISLVYGQNGDKPKRRQVKTATVQNGDKHKRRQVHGEITKTATNQKGDIATQYGRIKE